MRHKALTHLAISSVLALVVACTSARTPSTAITLNPSTTYQTMTGWETVLLSTVLDYKPFLPAFDTIYDQAANDLGITRLRISVQSGIEHPPGYGEQYLNGAISEGTLVGKFAYNIINDNADPNVADPNGFDFTLLDWRMDNMVVPFKRRADARGEKVYSYLSYVDFGKSSFEHYNHPEEYAEFMLVLFDHLKSKYSFVPDGIDVINEPDNTEPGWSGTAIGNIVAKTGPRLAAAGYRPDFILPSTMDRGRAVSYFDAAIAVPGARDYVKELSFHCYADTGRNSLEAIASRAVQYGVNTVQNECWRASNTYQTLHEDLKSGRTSGWQQGAFNGPNGYYGIDRSTLQASLNPKTKLMRQYYKCVRPGAKRIQADTTNSSLDPLAFINGDGTYVVVIKAESAGDFSIANLPAGGYGIFYSTPTEFDVQLPDIDLTAGQTLGARIPSAGVITVYSRR